MAITLENGARSTMCDALVDTLDGGTIVVKTAGGAATLATCTFGTPAFGAASNGVATANAITGDSDIDNTGTAAIFEVFTSGATKQFSGTCGSGSGDMDISPSTSLVATGTFSISSMTVTVPAS